MLWVLSHFVAFRSQQARNLTPHDYLDILRRAKWKLYQERNWKKLVGNYLSTLDIKIG